jgi:hypothetical protein
MAEEKTVPDADDAFDVFQKDLTNAVEPNVVKWNLDNAFWNDKVKPAKMEWDAAYTAWKDPLTRTHEMTVRKNVAREKYEFVLRKLIAAMKSNELIPEVVLKILGILTGKGVHEKIPVTET